MTSRLAGNGPPVQPNCPHPAVPPHWTAGPHPKVVQRASIYQSHGMLSGDEDETTMKKLNPAFGPRHGQRASHQRPGESPLPDIIADDQPGTAPGDLQSSHICEDKDTIPSRRSPLFPARPTRRLGDRRRPQTSTLAIERAAMKHAVPIKAHQAEAPSFAPQYHRAGPSACSSQDQVRRLSFGVEPADFFPWKGQHPEDLLNELTTRNGFYDKLLASQNESLTARPSVLSSLKNKSGLQILSSLFGSALARRQVHCAIASASTFKPPPRVTLTDAKREAWLRDLASPSISLRRLSRTIPHGIRGKALLDHCVTKVIPIARAIWLIKCVGANEIRASKRKGTSGVFGVGGEGKWIRDWTTNVEQFIETTIGACGSADWKPRISYALRLVSHIYAEHLLDHEQYLSWLVEHFASASLDALPIWLLIVKIHQQDVLLQRQHGRRYVEALLVHSKHIRQLVNSATYANVLRDLVTECRVLMITSPKWFVGPWCWESCNDVVKECVVAQDAHLEHRYHELTQRNQRLQGYLSSRDEHSQVATERGLIVALDKLYTTPEYVKTAQTCMQIAASDTILVKTCIQWASSSYRYGQFRIYAVARLFCIWSERSVDIQVALLNFLAHANSAAHLEKHEFFRLCAELIASRYLSVGKYLQWLMACGVMHSPQASDRCNSYDVGLLYQMPIRGLPTHVLNLRTSLLVSLAFDVEHETQCIEATKSQITTQLQGLLPIRTEAEYPGAIAIDISSLSRTIKSEVAWWLHDTLVPLFSRAMPPVALAGNFCQRWPEVITVEGFHTLRHIFENIQEYGVFVRLLKVLSTTRDGPLLTMVADTVNYHFDVMHALGAANELFHILYNQWKLLPAHENVDPSFTHGLIDLAVRLPGAVRELRRLDKAGLSLDPSQAAAAPSPISDNMVEAVHSGDPTFTEEMEQMLSHGTSIDQTTLARVFDTITSHLRKSWVENTFTSYRHPELLARLRRFDRRSFDSLAAKWLDALMVQKARPPLSEILPPMICHNVFTLKVFLLRGMECINIKPSDRRTSVALEILETLSSVDEQHMRAVQYRSYRFLDQQQQIIRTHLQCLIPLIGSCIIATSMLGGGTRSRASEPSSKSNVIDFQWKVLLQFSMANKSIDQYDQSLQTALVDILSQTGRSIPSSLNIRQKMLWLVDRASIFNQPLSQLGLLMIHTLASETPQDASDTIAEVLIAETENSRGPLITLWSHIASNTHSCDAQSIRERAEQAIMSDIDDDWRTTSINGRWTIDDLFDVVRVTASSIPSTGPWPLLEQILDRLSRLNSWLVSATPNSRRTPYFDRLVGTVEALLRLLVLYQSRMHHAQSHNILPQICLLLAQIFTHLSASPYAACTEHILDVLAVVSDHFSKDVRSACQRTLSKSMNEPELQYIFDDADSSSESQWLHLVLRAATAADTTTQEISGVTAAKLPFIPRRWEMMQDATPLITENDTSLSLTLFGARKSVS